jgi:Short C-terminal domain
MNESQLLPAVIGFFAVLLVVIARNTTKTAKTGQISAKVGAAPVGVTVSPAEVAASSGSDVEARLATLERLRSTGAITEEEYAARRSKILDDL